ncbi:fungal zn(2)-Cys(6) binuclear cluster domain-containing protein [Fusarium mexicanum]|uniref:Fungal zn(2)-Cys(6) binuclear cluster domain-containing protein n=1 Tax=Fusarium mexicanum TaxID=751941 RepID=A0A8H5MJY0_9HYPO|nr:fungal zn(2)-Cys(6) binuclear cluster domain-containing protein [Fusarium mexicanum]
MAIAFGSPAFSLSHSDDMSPPASAPTPAATVVSPSDHPPVAVSQELTKVTRVKHPSDVHGAIEAFNVQMSAIAMSLQYASPNRLTRFPRPGTKALSGPGSPVMPADSRNSSALEDNLVHAAENLDTDVDLGDDERVAQRRDSYYREEQEGQGNSETSPLSTIVRATNEAPLTYADATPSTIPADGSRPHDFGPGLNDVLPSSLQMDTTATSYGTDEVVQEAPLVSGHPERQQVGLIQGLASPSTDQSLDTSMELDSWHDYIPFDDNIFDFFSLTEDYFNGNGLNMNIAAYSQPINSHLLTAQYNPQELISTVAQQYQLPTIASNLFPRLDHDASRWLATKPSVSNFDRIIVNRFLNLFFAQVPSTFTSFESFRISSSTHEEGLLAAAAFGGLYCETRGSLVIARALCSDARRLVLTRV